MWQLLIEQWTWPVLRAVFCVGLPSVLLIWSAAQIAKNHPALRTMTMTLKCPGCGADAVAKAGRESQPYACGSLLGKHTGKFYQTRECKHNAQREKGNDQ